MRVRRGQYLPLALLLGLLACFGIATAAPGETKNLRFDSRQTLAWDSLAAASGYHVYLSDTSSLPDHGGCLFGSIRGNSVDFTDDPPPGVAWTILATGFDEAGQGPLGSDSGGASRIESTSCVPARRRFALTTNGAGSDGVREGNEPRRNPSTNQRSTRRETIGVYLHSGEFFLDATDLFIPGRGLHLSVARSYRSQIDYDGPLGHGWDFNWNARLDELGADILFHDGTGRREVFQRDVDTSFFYSPPGLYAVLRENPDSSFSLRTPDGTVFHFHSLTDGSNRVGVLESIEDRNGNTLTLQYDHQALLTRVVDTLGRVIDFSYDASGHLTAATDFAGRRYEYGYNAAGELTTFRSPTVTGTPNGNDFPDGKTTSYGYDSSPDPSLDHNLLTVVFPNEQSSGTAAIVNTYETAVASFELDRVVSQTIGGTGAGGVPAGGQLRFSYEALNSGAPEDLGTPRRRTTVTDRNGNISVHTHNFDGNLLTLEERTNRDLRPGEGDYTSSNTYNADGEILLASLPGGNRIEYSYDTPGTDRYREGNLLERRQIADAAAAGGRGDGHGGELNDVIWTFTYEPVYNQRATATDPRGNDPTYAPQNGGVQSASRYTARWTFDYEEGDPATNGVDLYATDWRIDVTDVRSNLGDQNQDSRTDQAAGNTVRIEPPAVALDLAPNQLAIEGDALQEIVALLQWNDFGQLVKRIDPERNHDEFQYHAENDPDGDGTTTPAPPDGRTLDTATGGYLKTRLTDTTTDPVRNNKTDPASVNLVEGLSYDAVGNLTRYVDGRGVLTRRIFNELDQVMEARRAAATADASGPEDPATGRGETGLAAFGFTVRYEYDANDNRTRVELEDRNQDRGVGPWVERYRKYDILDNPVTLGVEATTSTTLETLYRYDGNENLVLRVSPEGNAASAEYDERDLPLRATRGAIAPPPLVQLGAVDPVSYDVRGGSPSTRTFGYDGNRNHTTITDGRGNPWTFGYDGLDRAVLATDPEDDRYAHCYDPAGSLVREIARNPGSDAAPSPCRSTSSFDLRHVEYRYDELNRPIRVDRRLFVPLEPARPAVVEEGTLVPADGFVNRRFEYDKLTRLTFVTEDTGAVVRHDWDGASRRIETFLPDGTAPDASRVRYTYDDNSQLVEVLETEMSSTAGPPDEEFFTTYSFDSLGRRTRTVDNVGQTRRRVYDSLHAVIQATDARGPMAGNINRRTPGRTAETVQINSHGNVTHFTYDGAGRLTERELVLTPSGEGDGTLTPTPDDLNPHNPDGRVTLSAAWDGNSLVASRQDDLGNATSYAYDNLNRRITTTADDLTTVRNQYDANDNLTRVTDANGSVLDHLYDGADRRTRTDVLRAGGIVGTTLQRYSYDGLHRVVRATDDNDPADDEDDVTLDLFYDSLGRLVEERQQIGGLPEGAANTDYRWRGASLLTRLVYPDGREVDYGYDTADRLSMLSDAGADRSESASFDYFGMGRIQSITRNNGVRTTMLDDSGADSGYDDVRRIVALRQLDASDSDLASFEYAYDRAGNLMQERRRHHVAGPDLVGEVYRYDSLNRMTSFFEGAVSVDGTTVEPGADEQDWMLDGASNWAEMTRNGSIYGSTPNNLNEYDEIQADGDRIDDGMRDDFLDDAGTADADGRNLAHDRNGNLTLTDDGTTVDTLEWDAFGRLVRTNRDGDPIGAYLYDALGRRTRRVVSNRGALDEWRRYLHASPGGSAANSLFGSRGGLPDTVIEERDQEGTTQRQSVLLLAPGVAGLLAGSPWWGVWQVGPEVAGAEHLLTDVAGSVVALTPGDADSVFERVTYDAYGVPTFESASNEKLCDPANPVPCSDLPAGGTFLPRSHGGNPNLFRGLRYDPELGLRSGSAKTDWGGLYTRADDYVNPNSGRSLTRAAPGAVGGSRSVGNAYDGGAAFPLVIAGDRAAIPYPSPRGVGHDWKSQAVGSDLPAIPYPSSRGVGHDWKTAGAVPYPSSRGVGHDWRSAGTIPYPSSRGVGVDWRGAGTIPYPSSRGVGHDWRSAGAIPYPSSRGVGHDWRSAGTIPYPSSRGVGHDWKSAGAIPYPSSRGVGHDWRSAGAIPYPSSRGVGHDWKSAGAIPYPSSRGVGHDWRSAGAIPYPSSRGVGHDWKSAGAIPYPSSRGVGHDWRSVGTIPYPSSRGVGHDWKIAAPQGVESDGSAAP